MDRAQLVKQFEAAYRMGWRVKSEDFPDAVSEPFYPSRENLFKALELISPKDVKFLVLGQDPYYSRTGDVPDATGVAFATSGNRRHSLVRIMNKVGTDNTDLIEWVNKRRVLLLNASLTVPASNSRSDAGAHLREKIWNNFIQSIIHQTKEANSDVKIIVWGKHTKQVIVNELGINPDIWAHHPCASTTGAESFNKFWETKIGSDLTMRAPNSKNPG